MELAREHGVIVFARGRRRHLPEETLSTIPLNLETDTVALPPPPLSGDLRLRHALQQRRSTRAFLPESLSLETVSALLWAGFGINRRDTGGRTAPSAHNWQEIDIHVVLPEGTITQWLANEGDHVHAGQVLARAMLVGVSLDVTASHAGIVEDILVAAGENFARGAVLARLIAV